ncbi:hypothetical protein K435DRAFT_491543 [Dendrothele bispora CBS 962.96]|uniref:DUF6533 domain-containing protein n=1 Tax=Dendrothele bispora (strain CBS 962.96) TaxID=1314807 RepID=A0A4S8KY76_DENBC|nr:hypothetical protein K435DRAFT_491543 [Dendrothele bispora CBS 962.96]
MGEGLTASQLQQLYKCVANGRTGTSIGYAASTLFLFDYVLTVYNEARYIWKPRRITLGTAAFVISRYTAMVASIILLLPNATSSSTTVDSLSTALRLVSIISSEFIVAVRTWAIWEKRRSILYTLAFFSLAAVIPAAIIVAKSIMTNRIEALVSQDTIDICRITISDIRAAYVVPYILTIIYEIVTLSLSLIKVVRWRKSIPKTIRIPLIDTLWQDGVLYFSWMLALGFFNIGIVLQSNVPQLRSGSSQLQAVFHSILSTRIVLHLADSHTPREISTSGLSVTTFNARHPQFTSYFTTGTERMPMSHQTESDEATVL